MRTRFLLCVGVSMLACGGGVPVPGAKCDHRSDSPVCADATGLWFCAQDHSSASETWRLAPCRGSRGCYTGVPAVSSDSAVLGDANCDHSLARSGEPCWLGEACDPNVGALVCDDDRHTWRGNLARTSCN